MKKYTVMFALENVDLVIKNIHFVRKQNVDHAFAITGNEMTDNFVSRMFIGWENYTFTTFEEVKDPNGIALDIGAWIATTAIWLSKNFSNVICVEADNESLKYLKVNLKLSNCNNTVICDAPISKDCSNLVFGPRNSGGWNVLNNSTSHLKNASDSEHDYTKRCVTFKQIIHDYVVGTGKKLSFVKCDIEGGEDCILDDILHYCLKNNTNAYISFHLNWWKPGNPSLEDLSKYYYEYFDCYECGKLIVDPVNHVKKDPFCSILFKPKNNGLINVKKINKSVLITSYKDLDELTRIVDEIKKFTHDIIIASDEKLEDKFPYFILKSSDKKNQFVQNLTNTGSLLLDSGKITELLGNLDSLSTLFKDDVVVDF